MKALLALSLVLLTGCQTIDRHAALPPATAHIPASLKARCTGLVDIPDKDLSEQEISALWARDRAALGACLRKDEKLAKAASILEGKKR